MPTVSSSSTTRRVTTMSFSGKELLEALYHAGHITEEQLEHPDTTIRFHVPGGGDWANCQVDIEADAPVVVTVVEQNTQP